MSDLLPIFALSTVLFPAGRLPLRVFEPRYVDMIKRCMARDEPFGVCLIQAGREVGEAARVHDVGTFARVEDFDLLDDGLLGITAVGGERFRIDATEVGSDQLLSARVTPLDAEPPLPVPVELAHLADVTRAILEHLGAHQTLATAHFDDGTWLGHRLAEVLPMSAARRQALLELTDPARRLDQVAQVVADLAQR